MNNVIARELLKDFLIELGNRTDYHIIQQALALFEEPRQGAYSPQHIICPNCGEDLSKTKEPCKTCGGRKFLRKKWPFTIGRWKTEDLYYHCPDCQPEQPAKDKGVGYNARQYHIQAGVVEYWIEFNNKKLIEISETQYHEMRELIRCYHNWHEKKWEKMAKLKAEIQRFIDALDKDSTVVGRLAITDGFSSRWEYWLKEGKFPEESSRDAADKT